jgi:hypothetical protein
MISWALVFSLVFLLFQPLAQAKEIEKNKIQAETARINARLKYLSDGVEKVKNNNQKVASTNMVEKAKAEEDLMLNPEEDLPTPEELLDNSATADTTDTTTSDSATTTDTSANTDSSNDVVSASGDEIIPEDSSDQWPDVAILLQSADKVTLGGTTPITVSFQIKDTSTTTIDKIDISIQEANGKTYLKDSFINYKNVTQADFTYTWDTLLAKSTADKNGQKHKIIVEAYKKINDQYVLIDKPATRLIEVVEKTWGGIEKEGFWNSYIQQNGTLSEYWLKRLECKDQNECKTRKQIRERISVLVKNGNFTLDQSNKIASPEKFNDADAEEISDGLIAYNKYVGEQKIEKVEEAKKTFATLTLMSDFVSYMDEQIDTQRGFEMPAYSEEILTAPEMLSTLKAVNKYQVKLASYDPRTAEELQALPFWPAMSQEISEELSQDPANKINSIDELKVSEDGQPISMLRPEKAKAIAPLAALYIAGILISTIDLALAIKSKNKDRIRKASIWFGISLIPGAAFEKVGAMLLGPIAKVLTKFTFFARIGDHLLSVGSKVWKYAIDLGNKPGLRGALGKSLQGILDAGGLVGKWVGMVPGAIKKLFIAGGRLAIGLLQFLGILKASAWVKTTCPGISITGKLGLDPFAWALCNILQFIHDLAYSLWKFSFCLLNNAISTTDEKCEFKYGLKES